MRKYKRTRLAVVILLFSVMAVFAQKPKVHILATGGTIAGTGASATATNYTAGQVAISALLDAVPGINDIADITGEQVVKIGSQDMTDEVWLILANKINQLQENPAIDAIVVTHGTDTMEETAYFLSQTVKSDKPVILTGAMRPSTALSADGPLNLYNAVVTAASTASVGKGVEVVMNGSVYSAESVVKMNTVDVETFQAPNAGALGHVLNGKVVYAMSPQKKPSVTPIFDITRLTSLPKVGIVYGYSNINADMVAPIVDNGYKGVIYAGVGNGNIHKNVFSLLVKARKKGILVVRSSRVPTGPTSSDAEVNDAEYQFIASQQLNPQKARILLMLALTKTNDWKQIQEYFNQ